MWAHLRRSCHLEDPFSGSAPLSDLGSLSEPLPVHSSYQELLPSSSCSVHIISQLLSALQSSRRAVSISAQTEFRFSFSTPVSQAPPQPARLLTPPQQLYRLAAPPSTSYTLPSPILRIAHPRRDPQNDSDVPRRHWSRALPRPSPLPPKVNRDRKSVV